MIKEITKVMTKYSGSDTMKCNAISLKYPACGSPIIKYVNKVGKKTNMAGV